MIGIKASDSPTWSDNSRGYDDDRSERILCVVVAKGGNVRICGIYRQARRLSDLTLAEGDQVNMTSELAQWVVDADRIATV